MQKQAVKILSFVMALLVLFSTLSFSVKKHYCGDFLVDVSFTGETEGCGMDMNKTTTKKKKNCCKDEVHHIEGQDELQNQKVASFSFDEQQFLTAFVVSYQDLFAKSESNTNFYKDFSPPDIPLDYQVAYQSFLI